MILWKHIKRISFRDQLRIQVLKSQFTFSYHSQVFLSSPPSLFVHLFSRFFLSVVIRIHPSAALCLVCRVTWSEMSQKCLVKATDTFEWRDKKTHIRLIGSSPPVPGFFSSLHLNDVWPQLIISLVEAARRLEETVLHNMLWPCHQAPVELLGMVNTICHHLDVMDLAGSLQSCERLQETVWRFTNSDWTLVLWATCFPGN